MGLKERTFYRACRRARFFRRSPSVGGFSERECSQLDLCVLSAFMCNPLASGEGRSKHP